MTHSVNIYAWSDDHVILRNEIYCVGWGAKLYSLTLFEIRAAAMLEVYYVAVV